MDVVPGTDTGQHREERHEISSAVLSPRTVMTAGVNEPPPQNTTKKKKGEDMEGDGVMEFPTPALTAMSGDDDDVLMEDGEGDASNNSSASDVETFNGKIVYNPDGSAYIIEGVDSELSDDDYDLLPFKNSLRTPSPGPAPQVVNALHIARHPALFSAVCGQAYGNFLRENNHKVPEIPVMHSYRVFTVKDETGTRPSLSMDSSYSVWDCGTVPVKPILMCFICKLSFGFTKSFVAHATGEHSLSLNEAEKELVSRKNISAVIQGVSAEPLLSFLEPIPTSASSTTSSSRSQEVVSRSNCVDGGSFAAAYGSVSSSSLVALRDEPATSASSSSSSSSLSAAVTTVVSASACPVTSVPELTVVSSKKDDTTASSTLCSSNPFAEAVIAPELEDLANIEKMAEAAAAAAAATITNSSVPESKSSPSPPMANGPLEPSLMTHQSNHSDRLTTNCSLSPNKATNQQVSPASSGSGSREDIENVSPKSTVSPTSTNHSPSPVAAALPLNTCTHHPEGKVNGVECPKCDMILGSSRSLGGHMTMMHSRNSCKTLKCPKCNWHYKYQETLEIHMKEKHPENEMTCLYCVTNQPHPRLARGETYTCGYKPYRCEVCNYSTTTKGNLSIHMQSDKHINNVQELQNGSLTPEHIAALQQQSQQQQHPQTPTATAASLGVSPSTPTSDALKKAQMTPKPKANWRCDVCNYETNVARNLRIHMTSEKHTHNMMVLQQNMKHMQHLSAIQQAQAMDPVFQFHPGLLMPADAQLQPEAAIADMAYNHALLMMASQQQQHQQQQQQQQQQHQQQQQQQQRAMAAAAAAAAAANVKSHHLGSGPLNLSCSTPSIDLEHPDPTLRPDVPYEDSFKLFQCCVCTIYSSDSLEALSQHVQLDRSRLREEEVLTVVAGTSICKLCTYKTNLKANFQLHCKTDKHLQRLHHVNHVKEGGPRNEWKLKYVNVSNPVQVRCNACEYYTNSLHKLQLHATNPRHDANGRLFLFLERSESMIRSEFKTYHCNLCNVSVRTKVNLIQHVNSLAHLRTENIRQMQGEGEPDMREVFVVKEDKPASSETLKSIEENKDSAQNDNGNDSLLISEDRKEENSTFNKSSDISMLKQALLDRSTSEANTPAETTQQHTCPFCNYTSNSEVRIQMHVVSQHSQKPSTLACPLCQESFREWGVLENHLMEVHHVNQEGVKRLMALVDKTEWMAAQTTPAVSENKPENNQVTAKVERIESPPKITNTVVTNGPTSITNPPEFLNRHITADIEDGIEVKQELMDIDCRSDSSDSKDDNDDFACAACGRVFVQVEDLFCHQNEMGHLENRNTGKGNVYFCWKKGCGLFFGSMTSTQFHFKEMHALKSNIPISERHVYKFRCTQCSLAFKTAEKLQLHMQYHIFRAATKCVLCGRSFRTVIALQKHVEGSHADMTKEELEQYRASLMNNPLLAGNGGISGGILDPQTTELLKKESNRDDDEEMPDENVSLPDDTDAMEEPMEEGNESKEQQVLEDYINSQAIAEDSYNDPNRKYKCHRCKVAFTRQSYLTSHNKTLLHRKGEKMSYPMEKYLDPNRPFKCEVCKESFTQKNILLVHYNSVSHLHKLKLSMKDSTTSNATVVTTTVSITTASTPVSTSAVSSNANSNCITAVTPTTTVDSEKKPYKCNLCKVSYSQASTLDIHVRSLLHQSKSSRVQELVLSGQLDLSTPLVERPDSTPSAESKTPDISTSGNETPTLNLITTTAQLTKNNELPALSISASTSSTITPVTTSPQFSFPLHPDHNSIMQSLGLVSSHNQSQTLMQTQNAPPFSCQRCGSMCSSQDALLQHQQLYCYFAQAPLPPLLSAAPTTPQPPLIPTLSQVQQKRQQLEKEESLEKQQRVSQVQQETTVSSATQINLPGTQRSPTPGQQMFRSRIPFLRPKPLIFRHLLEGFGFDVVMQFNENSQRRSKKDTEKEVQKEIALENNDDKEKETCKNKIDLPEINRSTCSKCGKGFSSIWVLKAHQEEMHKDIVNIKDVEKFADDFRDDYERRNAPSVPIIDDSVNIVEVPSPSSSGELSTGPSSTPVTPSGPTPLSVPNAATPPATSLGSQMPDVASSVTANHMAAQMQFNQLLMSMGFGMGLPMPMGMNMNMNLPFAAMNMHPPLIPLMMPPPMDPLMASAFGHPMMSGAAADPNFFAAQQKLLQQQQLSQAQQQKRARTRINDDQLKILRAYFDINNSPTEDQLIEMSEKSGLPLKVIKHWFRNTLFKERQRNKDSPYNFNNPPSTYLNLEEYEKTGETKITSVNNEKSPPEKVLESQNLSKDQSPKESDKNDSFVEIETKDIKVEKYPVNDFQKTEHMQSKRLELVPFNSCMTSAASDLFSMSDALSCASSCTPTSSALMSMDLRTSLAENFSCNLNPFASTSSMMPLMPPTSSSPPTSESPHSTGTPSGTPTPSCSSSGKRANRTRFTDYQIKVLQEFFETNAYPKDDDLEYLSKLLNLSPRVIVVWFQNARQKARKVYENQPPITQEEENAGRFQRTPGLNYQCKKCLQVFQRYYELIKHQKSSCFKDENPLAGQIKVMSGDERSSQPPTPTLPAATPPAVPRTTTEKFPTAEKFTANNQNGTYRCDKCSLAFPRFDLWREHQLVHMMNPTLFSSYQPSTFSVLQYDTPTGPGSLQLSQMKRKMSDDEESQSDQPRDKRLRTTILPEQLDYLYQQYQVESNPSRKMLENIAKEVGLKKRVVQVWFQNTRARERKGQFRAHQQVIHKRCPFCRALFKARSALESHLATRHADQYTKGDINIDALPDGEGDSNPEDPGSPSEDKLTSDASPSQGFPSNSTDIMNNTMKRYYEDSLRKYLDELCGLPTSRENSKEPSMATDLSFSKAPEKNVEGKVTGESPLDLSKPLKALMERSNGNLADRCHIDDGASRGGVMDDARSETYSESTDNMDGEESNPTSPSSRYSSNSAKRFRTQMTTVQLKVMKSIFVDYKTPSMCECESLGKEIGLPKRVVQVWFQNARAKEKKAKLAFVKTFGHEMEPSKVSDECTLCNVKYNLKFSPSTLQEHIFSKKHIENLKIHIDSLKKLTDGQDSDTAPGFDCLTPNHLANNSTTGSSSSPTINSLPKQTVATSLSGLTGGLPNFANSTLEKLKTNNSSENQRKEINVATANGDLTIKETQDDKEDRLSQPTNLSQENHNAAADFSLPTTSAESSGTPSSAAGLFPYMYTGFPGYYGSMPGAFLHHAMYPGALHGGGMMYDNSNMYSSPLSLLQLPASALPEVTGRLAQPGNSVARFSQDGKTLSDLRGLVPEADFRQAAEVTVDVGFVCKKCHTVYPAEVLCFNHQRSSCFQSKPASEIKATLKLVQCHVECRACRERFTTIVDFKFHCDMDRHIKRVQKLQREAAAAAAAAVSTTNNHFNSSMAAPALLPQTTTNNNITTNNNTTSNNNTLANAFEGNAAAGLLGRNGLPDMAQLFFSGMGMDSIRLGIGLDPDSMDPSKTNKATVVGCGVDAGMSIS